jgi:Fe2+ or Zn2+ uptake regulation protein
MASPNDDPAQRLRAAGLRITTPRLEILRTLAEGPAHLDADRIAAAVRARTGSISAQTVYNVLASLMAAGLVRRIEPAGGPGLYELRVGDNHHHLICRRCDAIADVDCAVGDAPCLTAADDLGYEIDEAEVIYWGRCPGCIATAAVSGRGKRARGVRHQPGDTALEPARPGSGAESQRKGTSC